MSFVAIARVVPMRHRAARIRISYLDIFKGCNLETNAKGTKSCTQDWKRRMLSVAVAIVMVVACIVALDATCAYAGPISGTHRNLDRSKTSDVLIIGDSRIEMLAELNNVTTKKASYNATVGAHYTNCRKRESSEVFSFGDETPQNGNVLIACVACCSDSLIAFRVATGLFCVWFVCL